jgi:hypothetical protein
MRKWSAPVLLLSILLGGLLAVIMTVAGFHAVINDDHLKRLDARRVFNRCLIALGASQTAIWATPKILELTMMQ